MQSYRHADSRRQRPQVTQHRVTGQPLESLTPVRRDVFHNHVTLNFDLWVNACRATAIEYMCTKFGVDSSSCLLVKRVDKKTDRQTRLNTLPTPAAMPAWAITT